MVIRRVDEKDFKKLVSLFKAFFKTHNRFQQSEEKIIFYLKEQAAESELLICEEKNSIRGAVFLVNFGQNIDGTHKLWKWRHFAFEDEEAAALLLKEAEKRIKSFSQTAKIELTLAETERGIDFYKANGYVQEGALTNHYRWGETCFVLSKLLKFQ